jgi:hypothetical protein
MEKIFSTFHNLLYIGGQYSQHLFPCNLRMGPIGKGGTLHKAGKSARDKQSSLLSPFESYEEMKCFESNTRSQCYKFSFVSDLQIFRVS